MSPACLAPTDLEPLVEDWRDSLTEGPERLVKAVEGRALMDADLFRIVLDALTENAVQAGATRIVISQPPAQEENTVLIGIEDNGPGMTADMLARSGAPFFTTRSSGAGFGLTIARSAMLLLGGDLSLASSPGKGLTIILRLKRAAPGTTS
ncbi:Sensor protein ZraS [compost metagenome]